MNLKLKIILSFIIISIICLIISLSYSGEESDSVKTHKNKTPQELKAEVLKEKLERRASGWSKPDKPSEFLKFHKNIRIKDGDTKSGYKHNYKLFELEKAKLRTPKLKSASVNLNWVERGPGNVSGRTRGLIVDPDDPSGNTWYTGSVGGGIWKTSSAGTSWMNLTPDLPNLATVCIAMSKSNTQVIYAGSGEGFGNTDGIIGDGIFKSINKGKSWVQLTSTATNDDFNYVNRIVVDPENENIVIAVTNTSVQKSINGGQSWKTVYAKNQNIQHIVPNPLNFNILYATAKYEGILKSVDKGETWKLVFKHNKGRIELAVAPSDPSIIYALNENSDLYVSNNSGNNWVPTSVTSGPNEKLLGEQGWYNNTLAVDPADAKMLIIGGINVYRIDVANTATTPTYTVNADTINTASFLSFINFGADYIGGGLEVNTSKTNYTNIEIQFGFGKSQKAHRFYVPAGATSGVAANKHSYQDYVEVPFEVWDIDKNQQLMVSFRDQDRNAKFNLTKHNDNLLIGREYIWINDMVYSETPSANIRQNGGNEYEEIAFAWPVLAEDATWNPNKLPSSKITINRSAIFSKEIKKTRLAHWAGQGAPYVHADLHNVVFTKTSTNATRIIVANDGGIAYSDNKGKTWTNPTNGYNTTQFYGVDKHPTQNKYIGGLQDNGSWFSPINPNKLSKWTEATGGDGFDAVWNAKNPQKMITSLYYNELYKSNNGGETWGIYTDEIVDEGSGNAPFITQIGYNPIDPEKLYLVGKSGVTISEDFGDSWQLTAIPNSTWGWSGSAYVESSSANPEIVWAASRMSNSGNIHVSVDGAKTFRACNNFKSSMGSLSGLATHPTNVNTAYALFSFADDAKILRTTDLGETWEDISGFNSTNLNNGFPNVATFSLLVMPHNPSEIWAGTEIGLFISNDNGESWEYADNGIPAVAIWEMKIRGDQIIVATHGRGIWTLDLPQLNNALLAPTLLDIGTAPNNNTQINFINGSVYDSLSIVIDSSLSYPISPIYKRNQELTLSINLKLDEGLHTMQLFAYKNGMIVKSIIKDFTEFQLNEARLTYENNFDNFKNDFIGEGFEVVEFNAPEGSKAIQSRHPYQNRKNITYLLKTPIIVNEFSPTKLSYRDIPMIEEGEAGSVFGSSDFYDYAIVEGTTNGIDWKPLLDGYDFRQVKTKAQKLGISIDTIPSAELFFEHEINLLETFKDKDTILIRFRLFSDPYSNGWGWIIDDLKIEYTPSTLADDNLIDNISIFPNPCTDELNVALGNNFSSISEINIYDTSGRKVKLLRTRNQSHIQINTTDLMPALYILEIRSGDQYKNMRFQVIR